MVDDGSADGTAAVVAPFLRRDPRLRLIQQANGGESAARNTGIAGARFDWLAFLDADDWLLPGFLEKLIQMRGERPELDVVHCGWRYVAPTGRATFDKFCVDEEQLFDVFAQYCGYAVNACIMRRALIATAGVFDTRFRACADWDFWQRVARTGARFGRVTEVLAQCRMRPDQASLDIDVMLRDGLRVVTTGHSADPRVLEPAPEFAAGRPTDTVDKVRLEYLCGIAALSIGTDREAHTLLATHFGVHNVDVNYVNFAYILFEKVPFAISRTPSAWPEIWERTAPLLQDFLAALEEHARAPGLASQVRETLLQLIVDWFGDTTVASRALSPDHGHALFCLATIQNEYIARLRQNYQRWPDELQQAREANAAFDHELRQARETNATLQRELQQALEHAAIVDAEQQSQTRAFNAALATLHAALDASEASNCQLVEQERTLQARIRVQHEEMKQLQSELDTREAEIVTRSDDLARAIGEVAALRQSRSWKLTAPLRSIFSLLSGKT